MENRISIDALFDESGTRPNLWQIPVQHCMQRI